MATHKKVTLTSVVLPEEGGFYAICPELDVASQGDTTAEAKANLKEALALYLEGMTEEEIIKEINTGSVEQIDFPLAA